MSSLRPVRRLFLLLAAVLAAVAALTLYPVTTSSAAPSSAKHPATPKTVDVRLISINDFHGNLEPPTGSSGRVTLSDGTTVDAGGAAYLATHVKQLRARRDELRGRGRRRPDRRVAAGLGAVPRRADDRVPELPRPQRLVGSATTSSTRATRSCCACSSAAATPWTAASSATTFNGAKFPFLGANVTFDNGLPALLPFTIQVSGGVPIGIIGAAARRTCRTS